MAVNAVSLAIILIHDSLLQVIINDMYITSLSLFSFKFDWEG